jgi:pimeloyl-ACP methyl ester carboxylesterase
MKSKTIVFITGAFVSHTCWDEWKLYFESKGFVCIVPPWPCKNNSASALRNKQPHDRDLAALTLSELIEYYAKIVKDYPIKPIIIGHSLGGLITQILVNRELAAAGVAIHSAPPSGVIPYEFSFLKAGWKALGIFTSLKKTYLMSFKDWQFAFVNGMPLTIQQESYERFTIPESKTVVRGGLTSAARVDFEKAHAPILLTSGDKDNIIPASLNYRNAEKYKKNGSVTDYKEFKGRNHFVLGQPTWKEDADYIFDWINKQLTTMESKSFVPIYR